MNLMLHIGDQTYNKGVDDRNFELQKWINELNATLVRETNQTNLDIARETNASNVAQANLAYERSLPVNQVFDMMNAGMSKAGALNKLAGGGQYTAPAMQMATMQAPHYDTPQHNFRMDSSNLMKAISRLGDLPANVMQEKQSYLHMETIQQQIELARRDELRKQEEHEFNMWEKLHGKKAVEMIDSLASTIVSQADERGVNLDDIDSVDKLVKAFDLNHNKDWLNMPHSARSQIMEAVHTQHAINLQNKADSRAEQAEQRAKAAEERAKAIHGKVLREFDDKHKISEQTLSDLQDAARDFYESKNARQREYAVRAAKAELEYMLAENGITLREYADNLEFYEENGVRKLRLKKRASEKAKWAWNRTGETIGTDLLHQIISGIVQIN